MKETVETQPRFTRRIAAILVVLGIVLCALVPLVLALEGPVSAPPGGIQLPAVVTPGDAMRYTLKL